MISDGPTGPGPVGSGDIVLQFGRVTYDGFCRPPVGSLSGDELVHMHLSGTVVDLCRTHVTRSDTTFEFPMAPNLTEHGGLERNSRAAWYMPAGGSASASRATR